MDENNQVQQSSANNSADLLASVRERALEALTTVINELDGVDAQQKFSLCMSALRSTDKLELLEPALNAALSIEDKEIRANSLLELVSEVDYLQDGRTAQAPVRTQPTGSIEIN